MKEEKTCCECTYYLQHYVKSRIYYQFTHCGHCTKRLKGKGFRKTDEICECFTPRDLEAEKKNRMTIIAEEWPNIIERVIGISDYLNGVTPED